MFKNFLIKALRETINNLEEELKNEKTANEYLSRDCAILLETNQEQRVRIKDLENNVEFLTNNLTPKKRASLGLEKIKNEEDQ